MEKFLKDWPNCQIHQKSELTNKCQHFSNYQSWPRIIVYVVKMGNKLSDLSKIGKIVNIIWCFLSGPRDALHISKSYVLIIAFVHQSPLHQNHKRICLWWLNKHNISITIIQRVYILSHELNMNKNICTLQKIWKICHSSFMIFFFCRNSWMSSMPSLWTSRIFWMHPFKNSKMTLTSLMWPWHVMITV